MSIGRPAQGGGLLACWQRRDVQGVERPGQLSAEPGGRFCSEGGLDLEVPSAVLEQDQVGLDPPAFHWSFERARRSLPWRGGKSYAWPPLPLYSITWNSAPSAGLAQRRSGVATSATADRAGANDPPYDWLNQRGTTCDMPCGRGIDIVSGAIAVTGPAARGPGLRGMLRRRCLFRGRRR